MVQSIGHYTEISAYRLGICRCRTATFTRIFLLLLIIQKKKGIFLFLDKQAFEHKEDYQMLTKYVRVGIGFYSFIRKCLGFICFH